MSGLALGEVRHNLAAGLNVIIDDGGRAAAGYRGDAGDCVARSLAIAARIPYAEAYDALADGEKATGRPRSARNGVKRKVYDPVFERYGGQWEPKMRVGEGCTVHLRAGELPTEGRYVLRVSKHLVALVDGALRDTNDPDDLVRCGTRCVYGWWRFA